MLQCSLPLDLLETSLHSGIQGDVPPDPNDPSPPPTPGQNTDGSPSDDGRPGGANDPPPDAEDPHDQDKRDQDARSKQRHEQNGKEEAPRDEGDEKPKFGEGSEPGKRLKVTMMEALPMMGSITALVFVLFFWQKYAEWQARSAHAKWGADEAVRKSKRDAERAIELLEMREEIAEQDTRKAEKVAEEAKLRTSRQAAQSEKFKERKAEAKAKAAQHAAERKVKADALQKKQDAQQAKRRETVTANNPPPSTVSVAQVGGTYSPSRAGTGKPVSFENLPAECTVGDLKMKIQIQRDLGSLAPEMQRLVHGGRELDDDGATLKSCGVLDGDRVILAPRKEPAAKAAGESAPDEVIEVEDSAHWATLMGNAAANGWAVLVDFSAAWCGPCKMIAPFVEECAADARFHRILFLTVDVDDCDDIAANLKVSAMPTFIMYSAGSARAGVQDGDESEKMAGADKRGLEAMLSRHSGN